MADPTGLEPFTPVKIKRTSATERATFRKCRRQWFLSTVHRLQTMETNLNFWLGELVHFGLEEYYLRIKEGQQHLVATGFALERYEKEYNDALLPLAKRFGIVWPFAQPMYEELGEMGFAMLQGYFEKEALDPIGDEVLEVEQRRFVPVLSPAGRKIGELSVRTDLVVRRKGSRAAVDHKTATARMGSAMLDIDDQLTAEVYAEWKASGEFPEEVLYNALLKKMPRPPERLKDGKPTKEHPEGLPKFSQRKDAPTTEALYRQALADAGLTEEGYEEILAHLREREESGQGWYWREETFRTPGQMAQFEQNLYHEFRDMVDVGKHPEKAYPSPSPFACPSCPVADLCRAMMDGSDVGHLITSKYYVGEPRY